VSHRRRSKRRKKAGPSWASKAREREEIGRWSQGAFLDDFVLNWLLLPFYAVYAIVLVVGFPLYALVDRCSSAAAKLRRARAGPSGEGELGLAFVCGLITFGVGMVPVAYFFASPWLLYGGLIFVGLVLISLGVRSIVTRLRSGSAGSGSQPPAVDR
jgi:hypothetical protein